VSNNQATFTTKYSVAGIQVMTAIYSGDSNNQGSTSPALTEDAGNVPYLTTTTVATSGSPSYVGQPVTFTATVTSAYGAIPNGEVVTFDDGSKEIGTGTIANGTASLTYSSLSAKTHTIKATYAGDATFKKSSATVTQVVDKYSTTTTFTSGPNPSSYGETVTWTATVTTTGPYTPTGKVEFTGVGTATLSGGVATISKTWLNAATYAVIAEYEGDSNNATSDSSVLDQIINPASTTTTVTSSVNPSTQGQLVTFTATVTSATGASPIGTVTFTAGSTVLGVVTIGNSPTSVSTSTLAVGNTTITATYNGDTDFSGSSASLTQTVN